MNLEQIEDKVMEHDGAFFDVWAEMDAMRKELDALKSYLRYSAMRVEEGVECR